MATIANNSCTEINTVIIGETGTGKSTLINYLTNLFHNGSLDNLKVAIPTRYLPSNMFSIFPEHHEKYLDDITRCKTSECIKYQYKVQQVYFNFFDTPGINNTDDDETFEKIFQCIQSFDYLSALILVLNGTQTRLTINLKNLLERLHDRLPDIFYSNIILILTNCSSHTVNLDSINSINHPPIFHMQNSAFSSDPQSWSEQIYEILQYDWNKSIQTMNEFIKTLVLLTPIPTKSLTDINNNRNSIRSILHETRLMIVDLQHIENELIEHEQTQTKTIQVNEITLTSYHNTICLQCNIVCHERCTLDETTEIGENVFRHCKTMNNGQCLICPGKCSSDMHYHDRRLIKSVSRTLKFAMNKYNETEKDKTVQETKHFIEELLQEQFNKVRDACLRVQNDCQGFNIAEELYTFIKLLKNDMMELKSASVIRKAMRFVENLEILANNDPTMVSKSSHPKRKIRTSKKRNQPPVTCDDLIVLNPTSDLSNSQKYAEYTTEQLIDLTQQSIEKQTLISKELNLRCEGTSMGYLSPIQLLTLCEYYTSSRLLGLNELNRLHEQLQSEIQQSTDSDPFEILSVPINKLLHLTAIKLCLQNLDRYE